MAGNFEAGNSINITVTVVVGQHSRVTAHCYPLMSQILQQCLLRDFGTKQFHCQMSCDLKVTNESTHCWEETSCYITNHIIKQSVNKAISLWLYLPGIFYQIEHQSRHQERFHLPRSFQSSHLQIFQNAFCHTCTAKMQTLDPVKPSCKETRVLKTVIHFCLTCMVKNLVNRLELTMTYKGACI